MVKLTKVIYESYTFNENGCAMLLQRTRDCNINGFRKMFKIVVCAEELGYN